MPKEVTYTFRVAGQLFRLRGDERLLMAAPNMAPFRVPDDSCADADLRFDVSIRTVAALAEPEGVEPFFTDNSEADMPRIEIYRSADEWLFRVAQVADAPVCCEIRMSKDFRRAVLTLQEGAPVHTQRFAIDNAAMLVYAFATVGHKTLLFHSSVTVRDGLAYMFLGHSGTGKSTHSQQWKAAFPEVELLNDDNPAVRIMDDRTVRVYGTPWSGKTPCYKASSAPVAALVQLAQAPENSITRLRMSQAYPFILASVSGLKVLPKMMDQIYESIALLLELCPVYKLECLPNPDAARVCYEEINRE